MSFNDFKIAVSEQFTRMQDHTLFTSASTKDELWDTYLQSFPEGTNPIFRERTEHDCNCCKQFIRSAGNVLAIVNNELVSIWDINIGGHYQIVADALSKLTKEKGISSLFLNAERAVGTDRNFESKAGSEPVEWKHFHQVLPRSVVITDGSIGKRKGEASSNFAVLKRSITEISEEAIEIVSDLIAQKTLYRGEEHTRTINTLLSLKRDYDKATNKDHFVWLKSVELGRASSIRNTVIGTLLTDITAGEDLEIAVKKFEVKVAPQNYKRPSALITQSMINNAQAKVAELGIEDALHRRFARTSDVTINNVLFADRSAKEEMGVFGELSKSVSVKTPNMDNVEEISIDDFITRVLPKADSIELMLENKHSSNLVSLVAPQDSDVASILKWNNNFTWSYNGEVTDSMKERVKMAGGNVDGVLRFSIQWNEDGDNRNDLDAHCREPRSGAHIYFNSKGRRHPSSGMLDVDIMSPGDKIAVENIIYTDISKMPIGDYRFQVHNYSDRGGKGFTAEIEFNGQIFSFSHQAKMRDGATVDVGTVNLDKHGNFTMGKAMPNSESVREIWNVSTQKFHKVKMVMHSPNFWDDQTIGNKHFFFVLEDCINPDRARGFYNEFLRDDLTEHRKVFEVLSSKMKTEQTNDQLSGLGFSSTQRNSVLCKVRGSFNRTLKINF